jgi:UDP-N-acetylmuramoyl-L-alanyl-D-glutamate--2,6-diaminopimelate ligase
VHLLGITGTNGKTTTSYLARSIVQAAGRKCGVIGTIGYQIDRDNVPFANTTPGVIMLYRLLRKMDDAGLEWGAIEVSSHGLDQGRVAGLVFDAVLFTNLTQDHLDYHDSMDAYFEAKKKLFDGHVGKKSVAIINADDMYGQKLIRAHRAAKLLTYGFGASADIRGKDERLQRDSSSMMIMTPKGTLRVTTPLVGKHNLCNILAAAAFAVSQGFDLPVIKQGIEAMTYVPGRLERVDSPRGFSVFIDYAHTDDALKNVLESLRRIPHNGRIITVFGCGGDRDRGKRPKMGRVVTDLSDYAIITSDNPRGEDPQVIAGDIVAGVISKNFEIELDRRLAIQKALVLAGPGDFVLVAGKGHERAQIVMGQATPFDDKKIVMELLKSKS